MSSQNIEELSTLIDQCANLLEETIKESCEKVALVVEKTNNAQEIHNITSKAFVDINNAILQIKKQFDEANATYTIPNERVTKVINDAFCDLKTKADETIDGLKQMLGDDF